MLDYLVGIAALHGHDPADAREWPWRDLEILSIVHHTQGGLR